SRLREVALFQILHDVGQALLFVLHRAQPLRLVFGQREMNAKATHAWPPVTPYPDGFRCAQPILCVQPALRDCQFSRVISYLYSSLARPLNASAFGMKATRLKPRLSTSLIDATFRVSILAASIGVAYRLKTWSITPAPASLAMPWRQ